MIKWYRPILLFSILSALCLSGFLYWGLSTPLVVKFLSCINFVDEPFICSGLSKAERNKLIRQIEGLEGRSYSFHADPFRRLYLNYLSEDWRWQNANIKEE